MNISLTTSLTQIAKLLSLLLIATPAALVVLAAIGSGTAVDTVVAFLCYARGGCGAGR